VCCVVVGVGVGVVAVPICPALRGKRKIPDSTEVQTLRSSKSAKVLYVSSTRNVKRLTARDRQTDRADNNKKTRNNNSSDNDEQ